MFNTFTPLDAFMAMTTEPDYTSAEDYVDSLFYKSARFGICDFIVGRLDRLAGDNNLRSAEEIREYAAVCLGLAPDTLVLEHQLEARDGGYVRIGRGVNIPPVSILGEETRGDTTVVTVCCWADQSKTVEAMPVEFHLVRTAIDWKLTDTVIVCDNGFAWARDYIEKKY